MLSLLIIWPYIFLVCFVCGWGAARFLQVLLKEGDFGRLPPSLTLILGLVLISTITGYLSLFLKIGFLANLIVLLGTLLLGSIYCRELLAVFKSGLERVRALDKYLLALILLCFGFILLKSAAPTSSYDTGLYHAQAIRWIEEYPVIPGLGNLHSRLAFNSTWSLPLALFGFSFLQLGPFHVLNGFLTLILALMSLEGLNHLFKGEYRFSNILRAGILLPVIFIFKDQLSSPTPDIPVTLLTCALFIYYLQLQEDAAKTPRRLLALAIVLLSAFTIAIKLSALPLACFIVILTVQEIARGRPANLLLAGGAVLFLVLPFFLRNIWLSGYLLYPFPGLDLFNFDWKIPAAVALDDQRSIMEFARDPKYLAPPGAVQAHFAWIPYWLSQLLTEYGTKLEKILLPSLLLFLDWLGHMLKRRACKIDLGEIARNKTIYLTAASGLVFWFFTAPDPRFALGFFTVFMVIIFLPFLKTYDFHVFRLFPWAISLFLLYYLAAFTALDFPVLTARLWRPAPYPQASLVVKEIQGQRVYFTQGREEQCWYGPLPCTYYKSSKFALRGRRIEDGFRARAGP